MSANLNVVPVEVHAVHEGGVVARRDTVALALVVNGVDVMPLNRPTIVVEIEIGMECQDTWRAAVQHGIRSSKVQEAFNASPHARVRLSVEREREVQVICQVHEPTSISLIFREHVVIELIRKLEVTIDVPARHV